MVEIFGSLNQEIVNAINDVYKEIANRFRLPKHIKINLNIVDEPTIRELNKSTRNIDKVTDVLTYPYIDIRVGQQLKMSDYKYDIDISNNLLTIGDIYICYARALAQSREYNHTLKREIAFLFCHGMLHILGYDHMTETDARVMEDKQDEILSVCKITRMNFKSGFVTIIGDTNVGKSTLINRIVGQHVSIISPKTQTTREKIIGVYNDNESQIVFLDTPGYHKRTTKIDDIMEQNIYNAMLNSEIVIMMITAKKPLLEQFERLNKRVSTKAKRILLINKIDEVTYERLYPELVKLDARAVDEILPISALTGKNVDVLINMIKKYLPSYDYEMRYYPVDEYTDKNLRHIVSEIIREKMLYLLNDEVPHGVAVMVTSFNESVCPITIDAEIYCEKESHKPIILGKNGTMIKEIGTASRVSIEKIIGEKVNLNLFVKVKPNWRNDDKLLSAFGYTISE